MTLKQVKESEGCLYTVAIPKRYIKMKSTGHGRKAESPHYLLSSVNGNRPLAQVERFLEEGLLQDRRN